MKKDDMFLKEGEALHNLRALEEIEKNPRISQRELSNQLGVALGITNALLKNLVCKGLVKIRGNNNRSLTYHLTHAGVLAKSKLAMQWTLNTIDFYREARQSVASKLAVLAQNNVKSVALYGLGELTEIAVIVAPEAGLKVIGIIDSQTANNGKTMLGHPIIRFEELASVQLDAIIVCRKIDDAETQELNKYAEATIQLYQLI